MSHAHIARAFALAVLAVSAGCGDDDGSGGMAGQGGGQAGAGSGGQAGAGNGGGQAGAGSGGQGGAGSGGQAGTDPDAGSDQDAGDEDGGEEPGEGTSDLWMGCPDADDYAGAPGGPHTLTATASAVYCAMFDESRTLKEELAAKAMLRVAPGSYGLPGADAGSFALPICVRFASAPQPELESPGSVTYTLIPGGLDRHTYDYRQPLSVGAGMLTLDTRLDLEPSATAQEITLDGANVPTFADGGRASFTLCEDPDNCFPARHFDSCTFENATVQVHSVQLGGDGQVELELHIGESFASTEPGAFVRASGTFRGRSFEQRDYWKLVYNPEHHHFARDFAVLFDEPIDGACGIEIARLEPFPDGTEPDEAYTIDCELDRIDTLSVTGHTFDDGS